MGNSSLIFWEVLTFIVLMAVLFVFYPAIRRRKRRLRDLMQGSKGRYAEPEHPREEYQEIRDDMKKTTEDDNAR